MTYDLFGLARWNAHSAAKVDAWVMRQETDLTFDMVSLLDDIRVAWNFEGYGGRNEARLWTVPTGSPLIPWL